MNDVILRHYPKNILARELFEHNKDRAMRSAWNDDGFHGLSAFLLPDRPHVGLWFATVVRWDSYQNEELIIKDLKDYGLQWIMDSSSGPTVVFLSLEEYAKKAVTYDRFPKQIGFPYNMPEELTRSKL